MDQPNNYSGSKADKNFINLISKEIDQHPSKDAYGFIGYFGSKKVENDSDMIFYPSANISTGEFIKKHVDFLKYIKDRLIYEKSDLIPFPMFEMQDEVDYISGRKPNQILLHNLIFVNSQHITERVPFLNDLLQNSCDTIYGNKNALNISHSTNLDFYYFTLINSLTILSNYPEYLLSKKTKHMCSYVAKHALKTKLNIKSDLTLEDNAKLLFDILDNLDSIAKRA